VIVPVLHTRTCRQRAEIRMLRALPHKVQSRLRKLCGTVRFPSRDSISDDGGFQVSDAQFDLMALAVHGEFLSRHPTWGGIVEYVDTTYEQLLGRDEPQERPRLQALRAVSARRR
jgi:hypothetical protein